MEFYVYFRTYNSFGGHSTLSLIPEFLLGDADSFGKAISELNVVMHFAHSGPPKRGFEEIHARFCKNRQSLPKVVFRRSCGQAAIDVASDLLDGMDRKNLRPGADPSLPLFRSGVTEVMAAIGLLQTRLKTSDDFDLSALLDHCAQAQSRLPATNEDLAAVAEDCRRSRTAKIAALSPWDRLGIDWRDFHPNARDLLNDPFFWDCSNDFAPHGNDTGADLLAEYAKWIRRNPLDDPMKFFREIMSLWGVGVQTASALEQNIMDEAAVALAFAELKLRAQCPPEVSVFAQAALQRQRQRSVNEDDWPHKVECLKSLDLLEATLSNIN